MKSLIKGKWYLCTNTVTKHTVNEPGNSLPLFLKDEIYLADSEITLVNEQDKSVNALPWLDNFTTNPVIERGSVLAIRNPKRKLTPEQLAEALYEGTAHLQNLAEKLARQHGKAEALTFFGMMGEDVQSFWIDIANQLIFHSTLWDKNKGSACVLSEEGKRRLRERKENPTLYTLKDLRDFLNTLNDTQLAQQPRLTLEDSSEVIRYAEILSEDYVNPDGEGMMPVSDYKPEEHDDYPVDHEDHVIIEKGYVVFHTDILDL